MTSYCKCTTGSRIWQIGTSVKIPFTQTQTPKRFFLVAQTMVILIQRSRWMCQGRTVIQRGCSCGEATPGSHDVPTRRRLAKAIAGHKEYTKNSRNSCATPSRGSRWCRGPSVSLMQVLSTRLTSRKSSTPGSSLSRPIMPLQSSGSSSRS